MITQIESRFKEITLLNEMNLTKYPIKKSDYKNQQQKTSKEAAKERGYITTPIFLVDAMIAMKYNELTPELQTCDLCAGEAGQFTVRLMRMLYNKFNMNVLDWLKNNHTLVELDLSACAKLVYIYGPEINLFCGDATKLSLIEDGNDTGIIFWNGKTWESNQTLNTLIKLDIVKNSVKLLDFIFKNYTDNNKLEAMLKKLS